VKTLLRDEIPAHAAGAVAPNPEDFDSLLLAAARLLDAHLLAVTAVLNDLYHDCSGCLECTTVYVLEHLRETALDQVAAVLIGVGAYGFDEESSAYAEALERAETLAAELAAARLSLTDNTLGEVPEAQISCTFTGRPTLPTLAAYSTQEDAHS
jgi:hypothetical protein